MDGSPGPIFDRKSVQRGSRHADGPKAERIFLTDVISGVTQNVLGARAGSAKENKQIVSNSFCAINCPRVHGEVASDGGRQFVLKRPNNDPGIQIVPPRRTKWSQEAKQ